MRGFDGVEDEVMLPALMGAWVAGLLGSPHCVGMCGGFATAVTGEGGSAIPWHVGRLLTYVVLGGLAGGAASVVPGASWVVTGVAILLLGWFSARLAGWTPRSRWIPTSLTRAGAWGMRRRSVIGRVVFGTITGLLPCGLVYAALSVPVALADPGWGALAMAAFWTGTLPALSVASGVLRRLAGATPWVRRGVAAGVFLAGLWSLGTREANLWAPVPSDTPTCHHAEAPPS